jgi:hypothetical protein
MMKEYPAKIVSEEVKSLLFKKKCDFEDSIYYNPDWIKDFDSED